MSRRASSLVFALLIGHVLLGAPSIVHAQGRCDRACLEGIAEQYLASFGNLARAGNTFVVPASLSDVGSMIALATGMLRDRKGPGPAPTARS